MKPEVITSYEEIALLGAKVRRLYEDFNKKIPATSDLKRYIDLCDGIVEKFSTMEEKELVSVHRAQRLFSALVQCNENLQDLAEKAELNHALSQIAANSLDPRTPGGSHALNMIFELDFLQYIRFRGLEARLGEPDIVISAPFGNYFVVCKTINSFNNLSSNLEKGSAQITRNGFGVVALNLEPHICFEEPYKARSVFEVRTAIARHLETLYEGHKELINNHLSSGDFDGVTLQISCIAKIAESSTDLDTVTHNVYYSRPNVQSRDSHNRFDGFRQAMIGR
ncbi:hypothetical protein [Pseudomonas graminis]|uniref:Uncharacterized protein n=1 Tax=Pseudomonas graminis TaxID=158627 RepID=A0A1C2DY59_9PSED|nr:hypothetical protein [Pseudomonas graminis]OCX19573.1 hypothetical protein BBI10_14325 [Pseudomonas graminis]